MVTERVRLDKCKAGDMLYDVNPTNKEADLFEFIGKSSYGYALKQISKEGCYAKGNDGYFHFAQPCNLWYRVVC